MASAIPHHPAAAPSPSSASPLQFSSVAEANSYRLKAIVERLSFICRGAGRFDPAEFSSLSFALARGVDYALTISDVPAVAHRLPSLMKQTYERRNNSALQPAIMVLSISAKNACKYGWFRTADADEILRMANELFDSFCMTQSVPTGLADPLDVILKIIPRFYPQLKFCSLIVSFEAKILGEVGKDVSNVAISADGSWNPVVEHNERKDQVDSGAQPGQQDCNMECGSNKHANTLEDVDLTTEDDKGEETMSLRQAKHLNGLIIQSDNHACETEDTKPFKYNRDFFGSQVLSESPLASYGSVMTNPPSSVISNGIWCRNFSNSVSKGSPASARPNACAVGTSESLLAVMTNPVMPDDVSPVFNQEPLVALQASQSTFPYEHLSQVRHLVENMQLQLPQQVGSSMVSREVSRPPIPRHVNRTPIAVQALPVQDQLPSSFKRMRINGPSVSSSSSPMTVQPLTEIPGGLGAASGNMELQQYLRTPDLSMIQDRDHQNQPHIRSAAWQQAAALPTSNPISTRVPPIQSRGAGAYRVSQPPFDAKDARRHLYNSLRSQYTNQSSSGTLRSNPGLTLGASRELPGQHVAQQLVSPVGGAANTTQASRIAPSGMTMASSPRLSSTEEPQNMTELQPDQNWRPTGRMRGSLTGSAYSAALNQYLTPTQLTPRPPVPSVVPSISDQLPELNANTLSAHEPTTQPGHGDVGSRPGGSSI
ncbi:E4 SUMO-protein ligase PIAL2-like isoform X2 [Iris pallida]|uniref:E4 SUMO-protein ligase PIAL2-like isoform X2 n=1 Tax=Iris pallida TaxID=29817 RepID=A0AAX6FPY8_IRIPA|nr:E4 SUMO-protein ligase PIAL2-like isoform X2 [Iris pallida]